jgi:hypothetical protein
MNELMIPKTVTLEPGSKLELGRGKGAIRKEVKKANPTLSNSEIRREVSRIFTAQQSRLSELFPAAVLPDGKKLPFSHLKVSANRDSLAAFYSAPFSAEAPKKRKETKEEKLARLERAITRLKSANPPPVLPAPGKVA